MPEHDHTHNNHLIPRRQRNLTDDDIEELLLAIEKRSTQTHSCRFINVSEDDFYESVRFFKTFNEGLTSGRNIVAKTILILLITFLFGMLGAGFIAKIKTPYGN